MMEWWNNGINRDKVNPPDPSFQYSTIPLFQGLFVEVGR
jgi:hypothetical protein